ncbi:hypothetical protein [Nocardia asiatica]|uniref:hypothetical protein n=1 Tax=Nocardia asiatica TaxID=209252 RepID=UPI0024538BD2|nr:hypothetical protein [Nocardia asiatica]
MVPRPGDRAVRRAVCWVLLRYGLVWGYHDDNDHQGRFASPAAMAWRPPLTAAAVVIE